MRRSLLVVLLALSCAVQRSEPSAEGAWAAAVDRLRHSADASLEARRLDDAEAELRRLLALPAPAGLPRSGELLQDAHFALGRVLLLQRRFELALAEADVGLGLTPERTVFRANLHALRAMAWEALGRPTEAVADYEAALQIHKALFDEALIGKDDG